jgi:phosphatidate cytidylyltransferase
MSNLQQRMHTGAIAAVLVLIATFAHPYSFTLILLLSIPVFIREWERLNIYGTLEFRLIGAGYIIPALIALYYLRREPLMIGEDAYSGAWWILGLFALVWTTDIAAYAFGRSIGGPKIAPHISPKKTWAGIAGAMICTGLVAYFLAAETALLSPLLAAFIGAFFAVLAQAGDFFESHLKRRANVKDSGTLFPGHGGLLDRVDGLLAVTLFYALLVVFIA